MIKTSSNLHALVSAGSLVGEITALHNLPAMETYRALTFIKALRIPTKLYHNIVENINFLGYLASDGRAGVFAITWLFGESLSYTTQNRIADEMVCHHIKKGESHSLQEYDGIAIVKEGTAKLYRDDVLLEEVSRGDFFGEDAIILDRPSHYRVEAESAFEFCTVGGDILRDIPIVQWKLIESMERRRHLWSND